MSLRTPRRRISPRTKRRCRAIKGFFKRVLGTVSQPDIPVKGNSSNEISVTNLKNTILGTELLNKVIRYSRDSSCLETSSRQESENSMLEKHYTRENHLPNSHESKYHKSHIYHNSASQNERFDETEDSSLKNYNDKQNNMNSSKQNIDKTLQRHKRNSNNYVEKKDSQTNHFKNNYKNTMVHQSRSHFHSLHGPIDKHIASPGCSKHNKIYSKRECFEPNLYKESKDRTKIKTELQVLRKKSEDRCRRIKRPTSLDQEFITNIINQQYKPIKLFSRRESDLSQFSAPVCRDQEFVIRNEVQKKCDLCSCCCDRHKRYDCRYLRSNDCSDLRSVCDARLYSSKRRKRNTHKRETLNDYNDSTYYDIVPVKEMSSPKTRSKFVEDSLNTYQYYKEVPPSPRTHKPRLNLKTTQLYDENYYNYDSKRRRRTKSKPRYKDYTDEDFYKNIPEVVYASLKNKQQRKLQRQIMRKDVGTTSNFVDEQTDYSNNDTTLNMQTTESTEKTLNEIKNILQNFLLEMKQESNHSNKSSATHIADLRESSENLQTNTAHRSKHNLNNFTVGQCSVPPYISPYPNPCCYPILPMCPMNCMQNGYIVPSPSYAYTSCANNSKNPENASSNNKKNESEQRNPSKDTQELIREIYKYVSRNPVKNENHTSSLKNREIKVDKKLFATRSVGGSSKLSKHDAYVGTPTKKCVSKSCEAIGYRLKSDTLYTNTNYSDTVLEKLSLEQTRSSTDSEASSESIVKKVKSCKLKRMLRNLRLWKTKKKHVIEELSESENTIRIDKKTKPPPFRQNIVNYNVHGQEIFHPHPMPRRHPHERDYNCYGYDPHIMYHYPNPHSFYGHPYSPQLPNATRSNCQHHFNKQSRQVPVCLKEIEVQSIGTQCDQKETFLNKFAKKMQQSPQPNVQQRFFNPTKENIGKFRWKNFQQKAKQGTDAYDFTLKTQKKFAQGDMNMRGAIIKKLFYKRNPFSPGNLIVKTLLGNHPTSYGDTPKMYKPRMFI